MLPIQRNYDHAQELGCRYAMPCSFSNEPSDSMRPNVYQKLKENEHQFNVKTQTVKYALSSGIISERKSIHARKPSPLALHKNKLGNINGRSEETKEKKITKPDLAAATQLLDLPSAHLHHL